MNANVHKAHPWHGIPMGENAPDLVTAFIEIVPTDTVKYEIDKQTGYLKIDRPQKYSNIVPALYGFIPKTYCSDKIAALARERSGRDVTEGDGDALDIIVLCEKIISHGDITCQAKPIGGIRLIDGGEADDKIISVLKGDEVYGAYSDISELPAGIVERLKHYFLTYKNLPGEKAHIEITNVYGREEAHEVIMTSVEDYKDSFY
ncbi:inorganic pyrophosphatase [Dyadobacter frigoris]|uniref:inorganic diphosphatase n=1 Tax=Dyadobacter frigoris TaxID=2576211 RepID=A0A4U6D6A8_9BACT|nr:inorganic pyrophosphatase [Dyadobacter frigoris]TKT92882.1 inorganic pyrophosphatase [Dyadobacter frigoris]GLU54343.1 inorganic pyrophosphatase [Dyadobacter frigoris]